MGRFHLCHCPLMVFTHFLKLKWKTKTVVSFSKASKAKQILDSDWSISTFYNVYLNVVNRHTVPCCFHFVLLRCLSLFHTNSILISSMCQFETCGQNELLAEIAETVFFITKL